MINEVSDYFKSGGLADNADCSGTRNVMSRGFSRGKAPSITEATGRIVTGLLRGPGRCLPGGNQTAESTRCDGPVMDPARGKKKKRKEFRAVKTKPMYARCPTRVTGTISSSARRGAAPITIINGGASTARFGSSNSGGRESNLPPFIKPANDSKWSIPRRRKPQMEGYFQKREFDMN